MAISKDEVIFLDTFFVMISDSLQTGRSSTFGLLFLVPKCILKWPYILLAEKGKYMRAYFVAKPFKAGSRIAS